LQNRRFFVVQRVLIILILFIVSSHLRGQVFPKENSTLHYRIIGFSFPAGDGGNNYQLEIASGNYTTEDSFKKNIILSPRSKTNKLIAEVPAFASHYTWRIVYKHKWGGENKSELYHFSTGYIRAIDKAQRRLNIMQPATTYKDAYVFIDGTGVMYDMNGNPVWYIPDSSSAGDIKTTPQGTITYYEGITGYEIDYNGKKLWTTPPYDRDTGTGYHHHEFTRLANGHYMVLGTDFVWYSKVKAGDSSYFVTVPDTIKHDYNAGGEGSSFVDKPTAKNRGRYCTIIEYDEKGNVVWLWRSAKHLMETDYVNYWPADISRRYETHLNAFYFDEKNKVIYASYRNMSRIMKIEYPSGKVLRNYGESYKKGVQPKGNSVFCNQHSIRRSKEGYLYFFNNNYCYGNTKPPTILLMREPATDTNELEKVWEYECPVDGVKKGFYSGGIATELPDSSFFICLGSDYAKLMIVNRGKKTLWSALPEMRSNDGKTWVPTEKIYRANLITRKELEQLIWVAEEDERSHPF